MMYKIFRYFFREHVESELEGIRSDVNLTAHALGLVTYKGMVEHLEKEFQTDVKVWQRADYINESGVFDKIIDLAVLTFKDKLATESVSREADLMNRGAIYGAQMVRVISQRTGALAKGNVVKPLTREESLNIV